MERNKVYITNFAISFLILLVLSGVVSYYLDPFQIYHSSYHSPNKYLNNDRYQNAGIINRSMQTPDCCDLVLLGSSHSQNFSSSLAAQAFSAKNALNLSMAGAKARENNVVLSYLLAKRRPKKIMWEIHDNYSSENDFIINDKNLISTSPDKYFPLYLYDDRPLNDYKYIFSIDTYLKTFQLFRFGQDLENAKSWYDEHTQSFNKSDFLIRKHPDISVKARPINWEDKKTPAIDDVIIPAIKENIDIEFELFFPPYSKHFYATLTNDDFAQIINMWRQLIVQTKELKNVRIYAFDNQYNETNDLNNYKDLTHYSLEISNKILSDISQKKHILSASNIEQYISKFTEDINGYVKRTQEE